MTLRQLLSLAAFCLSATLTQAAGFSFIEVPATKDEPALRGAVWSPCSAPAGPIALGQLVIAGVKNCPIAKAQRPLIVVSHGSGGSMLGHHDTASVLADAGFVVAAINHPGDNFQDLSRQGHLSAFATRPVDMKRLIDFLLGSWAEQTKLDRDQIGIFGFSRGGYTALLGLGAVPNFTLNKDICLPGSVWPMCKEISHQVFPPPPVSDPRIKAAVVVDPLVFFNSEGLKQVRAPIQLWASQFGGDGVTPSSVVALRHDLPVAPEWHVAENAAHFAFLALCSSAMASALPDICRDDPGFDRTAFHAMFNAQVIAFFQRHLLKDTKP